MSFAFEDLKVYQAAIDWNEDVILILDRLGQKCSYTIKNQMERASLSIPLNIAEGNGRWHKGEKKQFFWIARGSTYECVAILNVMFRKGLIDGELKDSLYEKLEAISKMLSALIRSVDQLGSVNAAWR